MFRPLAVVSIPQYRSGQFRHGRLICWPHDHPSVSIPQYRSGQFRLSIASGDVLMPVLHRLNPSIQIRAVPTEAWPAEDGTVVLVSIPQYRSGQFRRQQLRGDGLERYCTSCLNPSIQIRAVPTHGLAEPGKTKTLSNGSQSLNTDQGSSDTGEVGSGIEHIGYRLNPSIQIRAVPTAASKLRAIVKAYDLSQSLNTDQGSSDLEAATIRPNVEQCRLNPSIQIRAVPTARRADH